MGHELQIYIFQPERICIFCFIIHMFRSDHKKYHSNKRPQKNTKNLQIELVTDLISFRQGDEFFSHPYLFEIDRFKPSPAQLQAK